MTHQTRFEFNRTSADNGFKRTSLRHVPADTVAGEHPVAPRALATFIHMSDLHVCDAKSPARVEFMDRFADPDYPTSAEIEYVGTYRAQEFLTVQVVEAMVEAANSIDVGPLLGSKIDAVLITGDVIDNGQYNELSWYKALMDGGPVSSGSGDSKIVEAAHGNHPSFADEHYYKPDGPAGSRVEELWGIVPVPGLDAAAHGEFLARGLRHKWLAIHGNHDALLQGTVRPDETLDSLATGDRKLSGIATGADLKKVFEPFQEVGPADYPSADLLTTVEVTPDPTRRFVDMSDWVAIHTDCEHDHGLDAGSAVAYWIRDFGEVRVIALDTVNEWGGWQGCIDRSQFNWLREQLENSRGKYVVLTSHHPLQDLFNGYSPDGIDKPILKDEVSELLSQYPNVIAWISGHVHDHNISFMKSDAGDWGFWQIRTASHMDWPQQSRIIEIARSGDGRIAIGTKVFDHAGQPFLDLASLKLITRENLEDPIQLAGISRLLAANDWQRHSGSNSLEMLEGKPEDRNAWLWLSDPLA